MEDGTELERLELVLQTQHECPCRAMQSVLDHCEFYTWIESRMKCLADAWCSLLLFSSPKDASGGHIGLQNNAQDGETIDLACRVYIRQRTDDDTSPYLVSDMQDTDEAAANIYVTVLGQNNDIELAALTCVTQQPSVRSTIIPSKTILAHVRNRLSAFTLLKERYQCEAWMEAHDAIIPPHCLHARSKEFSPAFGADSSLLLQQNLAQYFAPSRHH